MGYRNKFFEKICRFKQDNLKSWLADILPGSIVGDGYVYYEGTFPVLLTAHMDTVHMRQCDKVKYEWDTKNDRTICSNKYGIGGDDRCGIYMILKILDRINCSVLFCEDEETGSIGAHKFVKSELCESLKGKFKYIIELDRANSKDAVFYDDDNQEFHNFILEDYWKEACGSWSDICTLSPALDVSSVNFSCGYYHAHTTNEYVILEEMERNIEEVVKLLMRTDINAEPFKFVERVHYYGKYFGNGGGYLSSYDDYYDWYGYGYGGYNYGERSSSYLATPSDLKSTAVLDKVKEEVEIILEVTLSDFSYLNSVGKTEDECWKNMFFENPQLCFEDIVDWNFMEF